MVLDWHSKVCIPRIYLNPLPSQPLPFRASLITYRPYLGLGWCQT